MRTILSAHVICFVILLSLLPFQATAAPEPPAKVDKMGKRQAVQIVKKEYPGKVLKVKDQDKHYKVRVLQTQGRVIDVKVNKADGKVKKDKN